jgi:hypothetical protein
MTQAEDSLPPHIRALLAEARRANINYGVRLLRSPEGRIVVVLGEIHVKPRGAAALGKRIVDAFTLRGVETFQAKQVFAGRYAIALVHALYVVMRTLSLGLLQGSTITYARSATSGKTVEIERSDVVPLGLHAGALHLAVIFTMFFIALVLNVFNMWFPFFITALAVLELHLVIALPIALALREKKWHWVIVPLVAILTVRDELMAWGTVRMLDDNPGKEPALCIMGRAHLRGYERELTTKYGFTPTS